MRSKAEKQGARDVALKKEFIQAIAVLGRGGNGVTLPSVARAMKANYAFGVKGETYLGRSGLVEKALISAGVRIGLVDVADDLLRPIRDELEEAGHITTATEASIIQRDNEGEPLQTLHYVVGG